MARNRASAKAAGVKFERLIADYLAQVLEDERIDRRPKYGKKDRGDISGVRIHGQRLVIECKNYHPESRHLLPSWTKEAATEAGNDDALAGIIISKRVGTMDPAKQWVHCTVAELIALLTGECQR